MIYFPEPDYDNEPLPASTTDDENNENEAPPPSPEITTIDTVLTQVAIQTPEITTLEISTVLIQLRDAVIRLHSTIPDPDV